jgi:Tfp pilus assembly protein PilF
MRDLVKARSEIERAISLAPDIPSFHFEMGRIYQKEGLSAKAKEEFARCAALNATHSTDSAQSPNPDPRD